VRRAAGDPDQNFRYVPGGQGIHTFMDFLCAGGVAFQAHE
jgi:hypothetical protein